MKRVSVGVVGARGFLGGELIRLLSAHPHLEVKLMAGRGSAGKSLAELRPGLARFSPAAITAVDADQLATECEVVFTALPHGESAPLVAELLARQVTVLDLGSDFRLREPADHQRYYQREAPAVALLAAAHYGLPELTGSPPAETRLIACPGCFATAMALATVPLVPHLAPQARVAITGITGSSGSGMALSPRVHHALRMGDVSAYKVLSHQHLGELTQLMARLHGRSVAVDFVPQSGPFVRGIHLTVFLRRAELAEDPLALLQRAYAGSALVRVGTEPVHLAAVVGSCAVDIAVSAHDGAVVVTLVLDNLLKGGSGQAVQNLNLRQGWPETLGLPTLGLWP